MSSGIEVFSKNLILLINNNNIYLCILCVYCEVIEVDILLNWSCP
jgi:hypothetical protein